MQVLLSPHSPYWKFDFMKEAQRIQKQLDKQNINKIQIEHIGSTAIDGLLAKPTIDIMVGIGTDEKLDNTIKPLQQCGYIYVSKYNDVMPYRRFYIKVKPKSPLIKIDKKEIKKNETVPQRNSYDRLFHIHVVHVNSSFWQSHLAFRDHMRKDTADKELYQNLKTHLSHQQWQEESEYAQAKAPFIRSILAKLGF